MHSQQPLGLWFSYVYNLVEPLVTICASVHFLLIFTFIQHYFFSFILFDHSCIFVVCVCVCLYLCASEGGNASVPLQPSLPQIEWESKKKKKREKKHLSPLHSINHDSSFSSTSLVPIFIATHLNPCHHICLHPPANYIASFPQTTLISNDVFSACVGIRNINGG